VNVVNIVAGKWDFHVPGIAMPASALPCRATDYGVLLKQDLEMRLLKGDIHSHAHEALQPKNPNGVFGKI